MGGLRAIVEQHYRNFSQGHPERDREIMSADVVTEVPGAGTIRGVDGFIGFSSAWRSGFPDGSLSALNVAEAGDLVIAEGVFRGTNTAPLAGPSGTLPATGKAVEFKFSDVFTVREGKVIEHRIYFDQMAYLGQLGLLPEPARA